jgi:carbonic anhydrase
LPWGWSAFVVPEGRLHIVDLHWIAAVTADLAGSGRLYYHDAAAQPGRSPHHRKGEPALTIAAHDALVRLREGNLRFASSARVAETFPTHARLAELLTGQQPFAIILGCSDSRVPAEIVFDQGLGDLFVIRVAGNIVAPSQVGSVEFAADRFGTRLVVVLGHTLCGAILATLEELRRPTENQSRNLRAIVDRIRPSVQGLLATELGHDLDTLVHQAVRANIRASADQLRHGSAMLEQLIQSDGLLVVGAEYSLETGVVDFFDGVPDTRHLDPVRRQPARS